MILFLDEQSTFNAKENKNALSVLEDGGVIVMPKLGFSLTDDEKLLLQNTNLNLKVKSIKYNPHTHKIWGIEDKANEELLRNMLSRYSHCAKELIRTMFPYYEKTMKMGNTSLRPIEAEGRKQSKRHDDTRLHVDAFPSRPTQGERLLRVFCNVNLEGKPRVWNVGENFEEVVHKFKNQIKPHNHLVPYILKMFKITKSFRTQYDHYMLNLHDKMKLDDEYQKNVKKETLNLFPNTTWICYSDKVSHAVLSGAGLFEQTIYIPNEGMMEPGKSPLSILERMTGKKLV